ncbi:MAG: F0F1 ATP synthase subunit epsilon [Legionellales bacterium]|nr:F0F1 ATP synthase subunit epsilon [Legionellales bacterium]
MASMTIKLDIVCLEKEIFSGMVSYVTVSGILGEIGIKFGHAPLLTKVKPGLVKVRDADGKKDYFYISGCMLEIQPSCVTVLADIAEHADKLDEQAAIRAKKRAQELINNRKSGEDLTEIQTELANAAAQLRVIQELKKKDA